MSKHTKAKLETTASDLLWYACPLWKRFAAAEGHVVILQGVVDTGSRFWSWSGVSILEHLPCLHQTSLPITAQPYQQRASVTAQQSVGKFTVVLGLLGLYVA
ncbi:hypothetical protein ABBQ32_007279 [Trebouxia sp. C0010 RCD-2024]